MSENDPNKPANANEPASKENENFAQRIWKKTGFQQRYFWIAVWFFVSFLILLIPIITAAGFCRIFFAPAFLWSLAYLFGGALLGFIFGVPTIIANTSSVQASAAAVTPPTEENKDTTQVKQTAQVKQVVQANTNLTQISDWLTKVIVGAGLVELKQIPDFIKSVAVQMGKGMQVSIQTSDAHFAAVFSGGIIILFSTYGFVFGYLIMRIILAEIFAD
jgi:hypothetical protein